MARNDSPAVSHSAPADIDAAVSEVAPASPGRVAALVLAQYGAYLALLTPVAVSLSLRVTQLAPHDKAVSLSWILGIGSLAALVSNPLSGALSDRTTARLGRRRPWLLGGMVCGALGLVIVGLAGNIALVAVGWAISQLGVHATLATLTAAIADFVPDRQRGRVSGALALTPNLATLTGAYAATLLRTNPFLLFAVPALLGLIAVLVLVLVLRDDRPAVPGALPRFGPRQLAASFWFPPRRNPDFSWNFLGRFLVFVGMSCVTSYEFLFATDQLHRGTGQATALVATASLVLTIVGLVSSLTGGWLSDRIGRRKPFVAASSAGVALSLVLLTVAHSPAAFLVAIGVYACGFGLYMAVDTALAVRVLPDRRNAAKDLGVLNIANALPQSLVPMIAPLLLTLDGSTNSEFRSLFLFGAACGLLGALAISRVRAVR